MKRRVIFTCIVAIITIIGVTAAMAAPDQPRPGAGEPDYYRLVARLKNNDMNVDFLALRLAYTRTGDYKPYGADESAKEAVFAAFSKKDYSEAVRIAESGLEKNYVDLDLHLLCRIAYREMGNTAKYAFHTRVLKGLVDSLYASGDGSTLEKAIVVISVPEEYFLLNANALRSTATATLAEKGHDYDRMDVQSKKTGEKSTLYFNIDIPRRWLKEALRPK